MPRALASTAPSDYDELVDCPVEMGAFWSAHFTACGVAHRFVVAGAAPSFDGKRLLADTQQICETAIRFWHGKGKPPIKNYLFMLNAVHDGYGGLEHRNSTALICARRDLPRTTAPAVGEGYTTLLGLISHEYFHTWNVKRLRPAEFARYDYTQENYTELLWFFEGFTSYYDDLLLRRAGLIDDATYLKLLAKATNQVLQTPGRSVQTVAQASFDAWVKYYRQDENTPNATVSYYTKGALVALLPGPAPAGREQGRHQPRRSDARPVAALRRRPHGPKPTCAPCCTNWAAARSMPNWTPGCTAPPNCRWPSCWPPTASRSSPSRPTRPAPGPARDRKPQRADQDRAARRPRPKSAGMAAGDEWLGLEVQGQGWRIAKLDDMALYAGSGDTGHGPGGARWPPAAPAPGAGAVHPPWPPASARPQERRSRKPTAWPTPSALTVTDAARCHAGWPDASAMAEHNRPDFVLRYSPPGCLNNPSTQEISWPTKPSRFAPKPTRSASSPSTAPSSSMR